VPGRCGVEHDKVGAEHPLAVGVGGSLRVEVEHVQAGHRRDRRRMLMAGAARTPARLDAGSVLTSSIRWPVSARRTAAAAAIVVLPTPP
jgi:hypothetical protein